MLDVWVISRQQRLPVMAAQPEGSPVVVPAETLTFELSGHEVPATVQLDSRTVSLVLSSDKTRGYFFLDAFRSVGFHHLRIGQADYFFATDDAKLRLDGIISLLQFVKHEGLSWGQQLFFSNGQVVRDPRVDFAWLTKHADEILSVAREISDRPVRRLEHSVALHQPLGGRIHLQATLSSLRRHQRALLEEHENGHIFIRGRRYSPRAVVASKRTLTIDTVSNRRATHLLLAARSLAQALIAQRPPSDTRKRLEEIRDNLTAVLRQFPFSHLLERIGHVDSRPSPEEMSDDRYARSYGLHQELTEGLAWEPGTALANHFAFVAYSDQIYQAFVALLLAEAAHATPVHRSLQPNLSSPSFRSEQYAIYYDTVPPRDRFHNWRDESSRPSDMRPDISIVDLRRNRGILIDAKYRRDGTRIDTRSLNECQVYMHSFSRRRLIVCYPGAGPSITSVSGDGERDSGSVTRAVCGRAGVRRRQRVASNCRANGTESLAKLS